MNLSDRYRADDDVSFQRLEDTTVLVHLTTGRIHHTNVTGSRIWELISAGKSLEETLAVLAGEFETPREKLREDLFAFVERLSQEKMITPLEERE